MNDQSAQRVREMLERVYREFRSDAGPATLDRRTLDFVFHMTDWADDLEKLAKLYAHPNGRSLKEWEDAVAAFLIHVLGHLLAANELWGWPVCDPFDVLQRAKKKRGPVRRRRALAAR